MHVRLQEYAVGSPAPLPASHSLPTGIAVGDFNGDHIVDLVSSGASDFVAANNFSVLMGRGDGTFGPVGVFAANGQPGQVAAADFDEDGLMDIVMPATRSSVVTIALSNGDGTFADADVDIGAAPFANAGSTSTGTGDFNGDGHTDAAFGVPGAVRVLLGAGDGTFAPPASFPTDAPGISSMWVGDFDGNGRADALVPANPSGTAVGTMLSNADGTLRPVTATTATAAAADAAIADLNGDGRSDAVLNGSVALAATDGTLGPASTLGSSGSPAVGDADHDGRADVILAGRNAVSVLLGRGDGTFGPPLPVTPSEPGHEFLDAVSADLDRDGFSDLALADVARQTVLVGLNAPALASTPTLALGVSTVGAPGPRQSLSLTNAGLPPLDVRGVALGGADPADFHVLDDSCTGQPMTGGASCLLTIVMVPSAPGQRSADLAVASNSADGTAHIALTGTAAPALAGTGAAAVVAPRDSIPPIIVLGVRARRLGAVLRTGLLVTVACNEACTADATLTLGRALARRYGLPSRRPLVVARRTTRMPAGARRTLTLKLSARTVRALRRARRVRLALRVTARDAAGNTRTSTKAVSLRR